MAVTWEEVPQQVLDLASGIIEAHHHHLLDAKIGFIFRSEAQTSGDKVILGQASKISEKMKVFMDFDFLIWLAQDAWQGMTIAAKQALVDHELCHCKYDGEKASMRQHDIEEFHEIIIRHGLWSTELKLTAQAIDYAKQENLPGFERSHNGFVAAVQGNLAQEVLE